RGRGRRLPAGQRAVERERGSLALRAVERAHTAGLKSELEYLLERLCVVPLDLAVLDRGDEVGELPPPLLVLHHREHGTRLGRGDLGGLAADGDRATHRRAPRSGRAARARARPSRSRSGSRTPSARSTPTTSVRSATRPRAGRRACTARSR